MNHPLTVADGHVMIIVVKPSRYHIGYDLSFSDARFLMITVSRCFYLHDCHEHPLIIISYFDFDRCFTGQRLIIDLISFRRPE
jgi:hypothetical protein